MPLSALEKSELLYQAIESNKLKDINELLEDGANPNRLLISGITPFHLAIGSPNAKELVETLLKYHGNPNVCDGDGQTPLHIAAEWGKADVLYLLLTNGGDVDAETRDGHDVMWHAQDPNCKLILKEFNRKEWMRAQERSTSLPLTPTSHKTAYFSPRHLKNTSTNDSSTKTPSSSSAPLTNITNTPTSTPAKTPSSSSGVFRFDIDKPGVTTTLATPTTQYGAQIPPISITLNIHPGAITSSVGDLLAKVENQVASSSGSISSNNNNPCSNHVTDVPATNLPTTTDSNCNQVETNLSKALVTLDATTTAATSDPISSNKENIDVKTLLSLDGKCYTVPIIASAESNISKALVPLNAHGAGKNDPLAAGSGCAENTISNALVPLDTTTGKSDNLYDKSTVSTALIPFDSQENSDSTLVTLTNQSQSSSTTFDDGVFSSNSRSTPLCFDRTMLSKCIDATSPNHPYFFLKLNPNYETALLQTPGTPVVMDPQSSSCCSSPQNTAALCVKRRRKSGHDYSVSESEHRSSSVLRICDTPTRRRDRFRRHHVSTDSGVASSDQKTATVDDIINISSDEEENTADVSVWEISDSGTPEQPAPELLMISGGSTGSSSTYGGSSDDRTLSSFELHVSGSSTEASSLHHQHSSCSSNLNPSPLEQQVQEPPELIETISISIIESPTNTPPKPSSADKMKSTVLETASSNDETNDCSIKTNSLALARTPETSLETTVSANLNDERHSLAERNKSCTSNRTDDTVDYSAFARTTESTLEATVSMELKNDGPSSQNTTVASVTPEESSSRGSSKPPSFLQDCDSLNESNFGAKRKALQSTFMSGHSCEEGFPIMPEDDSTIELIHEEDESFIVKKHASLSTNNSQSSEPEIKLSVSLTPSNMSACSGTSSQRTISYDWKMFASANSYEEVDGGVIYSPPPDDDDEETVVPEEIKKLSNKELREKLISLGYEPGPVTDTSRSVYLKRLHHLQSGYNFKKDNKTLFSTEFRQLLAGIPLPQCVVDDANTVKQQFGCCGPQDQWRGGLVKDSFTYLLLDPRVTENLPLLIKTTLSEAEALRSFAAAVFYIGKGKKSRPYAHLKEAVKFKNRQQAMSPKHTHINEIWEAGRGVVSLHIFNNVIQAEAFTREAAMIAALSLQHLTNKMQGRAYGDAANWPRARLRRYGSFLLLTAMQILCLEGENEIKPYELPGHKKRGRKKKT